MQSPVIRVQLGYSSYQSRGGEEGRGGDGLRQMAYFPSEIDYPSHSQHSCLGEREKIIDPSVSMKVQAATSLPRNLMNGVSCGTFTVSKTLQRSPVFPRALIQPQCYRLRHLATQDINLVAS